MSLDARIVVPMGRTTLDVDLRGPAGPLAVIGPNGSGKTTLLRALAGAITPTAGRIEVGGEVFFDRVGGIDRPIERRRVGYVPQGFGLFPHLSVLDNVAFGVVGDRSTRHARAREMLETFDGLHLADRRPRRLSGGEQQRVALARALLTAPRLLLLDEPLSALDAAVRRSVRRLLAERLKALGQPSIVVTHDVRDVAALDAPVVVLDSGRVVQSGTLDALRAAPVNDFVAEFVGL